MNNIIEEKKSGSFHALVQLVLGKAKSFNLMDFTIMKICLSFGGLFFGIKFSNKLKNKVSLIGIIALFSYFYMIYKLFIEEKTAN